MNLGIREAWRWRATAIADLDSHVSRAQSAICRRTRAAKVERRELGGYVWGQFLDDFHHQNEQWGHFGTSAAVQVLAIGHRMEGVAGGVMDFDPLEKLADVLPHQLPDDVTDLPDLERRLDDVKDDSSALDSEIKDLEQKVERLRADPFKHQDFHDPIKTAFVIEALEPDEETVDHVPPLVEHLLGQRWHRGMWNPSPQTDWDRSALDRLLATAYVLHVLRRYPTCHDRDAMFAAYEALATTFLDIQDNIGQDLWALTCLALTEMDESARERMGKTQHDKVEEARDAASTQLQKWARDYQQQPVINRPFFNCYAREHDHDYIFLSPELLASVLFLRTDSPKATRAFVLEVVQGIAGNVIDRDRPEDEQGTRGFRIQRGMEGTVDQMWASRVLEAFHDRYREEPKSLRPPGARFLSRPPLVAIISVVAMIVGVVVGALLGGTAGAIVGGVVAGLAASVLGAALGPYFKPDS